MLDMKRVFFIEWSGRTGFGQSYCIWNGNDGFLYRELVFWLFHSFGLVDLDILV